MEDEEQFEPIPIATKDFADRIAEQVMSDFPSERDIQIWTEGDCGTMEKQLSFTIWYNTRAIREEAHKDGEADRLEAELIAAAIKAGYPEDQKHRIFVWTDSHQALARLSGTQKQFESWLESKREVKDQES